MSAGWFKLPGFGSAKMGPQKVYNKFATLLCCCPDQLSVQVSAVEPFLHIEELMPWMTRPLWYTASSQAGGAASGEGLWSVQELCSSCPGQEIEI